MTTRKTITPPRKAATKSRKAPWRQDNPKKKSGSGKHLTTAQKTKAKTRARKAGRPYPNLVDNMSVAKKKSAAASKKKPNIKKIAKKKSAKNKTARK